MESKTLVQRLTRALWSLYDGILTPKREEVTLGAYASRLTPKLIIPCIAGCVLVDAILILKVFGGDIKIY